MVTVDGQISGLCVVVSPGGKVIVSLAGAAVHLDLDPPHWSSTICRVSSSLEVSLLAVASDGGPREVSHLPGLSEGLLLQKEHWVGGGRSSQAEESESNLHVKV